MSLHAANHRKCGEEERGEDAPLNALLLHLWLDPRGDEREDFRDFLLRVLRLGSGNLYVRSRTEKMGSRSAQDVWRKDEVSDFQEFAR